VIVLAALNITGLTSELVTAPWPYGVGFIL